MTLYTTPLQFGYFFSLMLWLCLLVRGIRHRRLSDQLLGWVMFLLAMEMQDYTFGFAGINFLWNELNGFPRGVALIFGPLIYFYFRSQVNRQFQFLRQHITHVLPYVIYFVINLAIFLTGAETVQQIQGTTFYLVMGYTVDIGILLSYVYYFRKCLLIYRRYRDWSENQFSDTELIGFAWFRNFLYAMIFWTACRAIMNILDAIFLWDFYQDWWWNLALVGVSIYIGLTGFAQRQPTTIAFEGPQGDKPEEALQQPSTAAASAEKEQTEDKERKALAKKLEVVIREDRLYLQPELNLRELARHLKTNSTLLSATINQEFQLNFNDYINSLRIEEFIAAYQADSKRSFTLLSLALDSGFNSKATFNRAFKKIKGEAPKDYLSRLEDQRG